MKYVWIALKVALAVIVLAGVVYQLKFSSVSVLSHSVRRGTILSEVMGTGTLEARVKAIVSPKIAGRIIELLVDQGDRVTAGELLVRLDDDELTQQVAIASANVDAASAAIERLKTDQERSSAVYRQASKSHDRVQQLVDKNAASREDADKATEALAVAESGMASSEAAISEGQKELVAAQKTAQYHLARLKDTEIRAPFDGLVVKRIREPGDIVVPGSSILTIISTDEMWISAWVDETEMSSLDPGQSARVVFRSEPTKFYSGEVARLGREADRETREFIVDVQVLELPKNWAVGQRGDTFIKVAEHRGVLILPADLLTNVEGVPGVFVNVNGYAVWRELTLGVRSRESVEVLEGLKEGEVVISPEKPATKLTEGRSVTEVGRAQRQI